MSKFSKWFAGSATGAVMMATGAAADAADLPRCNDIDLTGATDIAATFQACINGEDLPTPDPDKNPEAPESVNAGCEVRGRGPACRIEIPRDSAIGCPEATDFRSRRGNLFPADLTEDGRRVGVLVCQIPVNAPS